MRGLRSAKIGGEPVFVSILTSLSSGGVVIWSGVVVVEGGCDGVVSSVGSPWAHEVSEDSGSFVCLCPVGLPMV